MNMILVLEKKAKTNFSNSIIRNQIWKINETSSVMLPKKHCSCKPVQDNKISIPRAISVYTILFPLIPTDAEWFCL